MVRATAAEVLKLFGGAYPPGTSAANIADVCAAADYHLDAYAQGKGHTLSTTDTSVVYVANMVVARIGMQMLWFQAGGGLSNSPTPEILNQELKEILDATMAAKTTDVSATTLDGIDTSDT